MTQKKPNLEQQSHQLVSLRLGETPYNKIKKRELWELLHTLIESPALGMVDLGDKDTFDAELRRVLGIYLSPDGVTAESAVSMVGGQLNYDTLLVLNQFAQHYLGMIAEAYDMLQVRPGEIEALADQMHAASKRVEASGTSVQEAPVEISFKLLVSVLNLLARMGNDAEIIVDLLPE